MSATNPMKATAVANSNIALVKYWGNRDTSLILPFNSSISMTLDKLQTFTTVQFSPAFDSDQLKIDGVEARKDELIRLSEILELIRKMAGKKLYAKVESKNNFPKSAGLASSASSFAALSLSASKAIGMDLTSEELSRLARRGSGSASRSICGGFVEWEKGLKKDGFDSYAKSIAPPTHWKDFRMIVAVVTPKEKKVNSRAGMESSVQTSPFYDAWLSTAETDFKAVRKSILDMDFSNLGKIAEMNALKMHSIMLTSEPHLIYWEPETITLMKEVMNLRDSGIECYFTIDAGPQVKIICLEENVQKIEQHLKSLPAVKQIFACSAGEGVKLSNAHLF